MLQTNEFLVQELHVFIEQSKFLFLASFSSGGAIYSKTSEALTIHSSIFTQCKSFDQGGCIFIYHNNLIPTITHTCFDQSSSKNDNACVYIKNSGSLVHSYSLIAVTRSISFTEFCFQIQYGVKNVTNANFSQNSVERSSTLTAYYGLSITGKFINVANNFNKKSTYRVDTLSKECFTISCNFINNNSTSTDSHGNVIYTFETKHTLKNCCFLNNQGKYTFYSESCTIILDEVFGDNFNSVGKTSIVDLISNTETILQLPINNIHKRCDVGNFNMNPVSSMETGKLRQLCVVFLCVNYF